MKKSKNNHQQLLHGNAARIDPKTDLSSSFPHRAMNPTEDYRQQTPVPGTQNLVRDRDRTDENKR